MFHTKTQNKLNCMRWSALRVEVNRLHWHYLLLRQRYSVTDDWFGTYKFRRFRSVDLCSEYVLHACWVPHLSSNCPWPDFLMSEDIGRTRKHDGQVTGNVTFGIFLYNDVGICAPIFFSNIIEAAANGKSFLARNRARTWFRCIRRNVCIVSWNNTQIFCFAIVIRYIFYSFEGIQSE